MEMAEEALVQRLSMLKSASQPRRDGGLSKAEDAFSRGSVQPFGQRREHHGDLLGGSFQMVQRRIASSAEPGAARRTSERLDRFSAAMLAIPDERMDVGVSDPEVQTLLIGTGETLGIDAFGGTSPAFDLAPGAYWSRYWSCTQRGSGGMSTDGAIVGGARRCRRR
jgi:hypothetical protein